ncbi:unnamed protein product [Cuscuta campestris]|uniref:Ty3 transposon capsid-like protein domain-containing protein n=1 Tax=Cuscuta campestris TaxID=132261 RepID=A0A484KGA3_9ASTE|nr:unnamed protein product [Cuscuta campestris]
MSTPIPSSDDQPSGTSLTMADLMRAINNLGKELETTKSQIAKELDTTKSRVAELLAAAHPLPHEDLRRPPPYRPPPAAWRPPPSRTSQLVPTADPIPRMRLDAPRFSGEDPVGWIFRIQKYFDYFLTPEVERLHLVAMLIDHPASEWFRYYQANNCNVSWMSFLLAVRQRFDPDYYENYIGLLSKLHQTTTVMEYQSSFETILNKVAGVPEPTLIAMYIAGLKQPVQREVNLRTPGTLQEAFALARELAANYQDIHSAYGSSGRRFWSAPRPAATSSPAGPSSSLATLAIPSAATHSNNRPITSLPIVRLTNAEKAERGKKGLCWYCDEKWGPTHHSKRRFLALMGPDEEDISSLEDHSDQPLTDDLVITGDISSMHSLSGSPNPRSLRLTGTIQNSSVHVLLDSGSTHNFIHPAVAECLSLVLHPVTPFRVYVGNGESLRCAYSCPQTSITLQGHIFAIDLYLLEIHGSDVVLGVQWLQTLGKVSHDYANLTMEFTWNGSIVQLRGDTPYPRPISYGTLCTMVAAHLPLEFYEIITAPTPFASDATATSVPEFPTDVPAEIKAILLQHADVFNTPTTLPPGREWDHRIHLEPNTKPVNVWPYRYPYFQKTEIERQYLLGRELVIRTDHRSLKDLLLQIIQTPDQQFYIRKLMGFKFRIGYKTGVSNKAADALSWRDTEEEEPAAQFTALSQPIPLLLDAVRMEHQTKPDVLTLKAGVAAGTTAPAFTTHDGLLYYNRRVYISPDSTIREQLLGEFHNTPLAGHQGVERTFRRLAAVFYWPGMRKDVRAFIAACAPCQATKYSTQRPAGLLQPLPVPDRVWDSASMDFITGLPPSRGYTVIFVVVDRLSKYCHFGPLPTDFDAPRVAALFLDMVAAIKELLIERAAVLDELKTNLRKVQQRMRDRANMHRRDVTFQVGDLVLLKLQPYRQYSVAKPKSAKLARRFYGPFEVIERVGPVAYRLRLPTGCRIHDVFHVSLLRPFVARDTGIPAPTLPTDFFQNRPLAVPLAAIRSRTVLVNGAPEEQWLIHWSEGSEDDATWEPVSMLRERFPTLRLEDKALSNGGGVDTDRVDSDHGEEAGPVAPPVVRRSQRVVGPPQRYKDYIRR